jgi:hypothetical protein
MIEEKGKGSESEVERLRRLVHPIHAVNPSRMKRILTRLGTLKSKGSAKQKKKNNDPA